MSRWLLNEKYFFAQQIALKIIYLLLYCARKSNEQNETEYFAFD